MTRFTFYTIFLEWILTTLLAVQMHVNIELPDYNEHTFISHWMYGSGPTHNMVTYTLADYDTSEVTKFDFHVDITYTGSNYECNPQYSYTFSGFKYREEYIKVGLSETTTTNINFGIKSISLILEEMNTHLKDGIMAIL